MLAHYGRLERFRIGFLRYPSRPKDPFCHRETFEPMIASLPPTLRIFAIDVQARSWQSWEVFRSDAVGLDVLDRLLAPSDGEARFPSLQRVELRILEGLWGWGRNKPILKEPVPSPLSKLKAPDCCKLTPCFVLTTHEKASDLHLLQSDGPNTDTDCILPGLLAGDAYSLEL